MSNAAPSRPTRRPRLRVGEAIYLVAAILLFVLMFFKWYGTQETGSNTLLIDLGHSSGGTAWQTLDVIPLFLMLAIVVAVGAAILRLSGSDWKPLIPPAAAVTVLGAIAAILTLIRIISPPELGFEAEGFGFKTSLELPVFLALAAALGIAYGGWRTMAEEGTSFGAVAKNLESPDRPARPKSSSRPRAKS